MRERPIRQLTILVVTDDEKFFKQVQQELFDCRLSHYRTSSLPEGRQFDFVIIDSRNLDEEARSALGHLGKNYQRIAVGDHSLNNILAKTHLPRGASLRSAIESCLEFIQPKSPPRGLRKELSNLH